MVSVPSKADRDAVRLCLFSKDFIPNYTMHVHKQLAQRKGPTGATIAETCKDPLSEQEIYVKSDEFMRDEIKAILAWVETTKGALKKDHPKKAQSSGRTGKLKGPKTVGSS